MTVIDDGSIGRCDDCGDDRINLYRRVRAVDGKRIAVYLCAECRRADA